MKFDVTNWITGKVQFTAEIDCDEGANTNVKLGLAVKWGIKSHVNLRGANLIGAYLRGVSLSNANFRGAYLSNANFRGADLIDADLIGADLRGADLRGANLIGADLRGAYLGDANLRGADLIDANLIDADLRGADLIGADLRGAYLGDQWIVQGATRSDGHAFFLQKLKGDKKPMVKAGCRYFTLAEAREETRGGQTLLDETREIVRCMVNLAHVRGLLR